MTRKDYERAINQLMQLKDEEQRDQAVFLFLSFFKEEENFNQARFLEVLEKSKNKNRS